MKTFSILVPAAVAGVLIAASVFAAPQALDSRGSAASAPDRAAAYLIASVD